MKKMQWYLVFLLVVSLSVVPCSAHAFLGLEAGVGYWQQTPSGTFSYKGNGINDSLDLKNDLKYDTTGKAFARVKVELPLILPNLYFMATPMSFDGTGSKALSFNYGGQTFSANVPYDSKLKLDHYDLAIFYPIPLLKTATLGKLNVELGLNVRDIAFEGSVTQGTLTSSKSLTLYVPMGYVGVQVKPISIFAVEAEFRGISLGKNHYFDYIGKLKYYPVGPLYIAGGYRSEDIKIDQSDVNAAVKFSGPFAEVGLTF